MTNRKKLVTILGFDYPDNDLDILLGRDSRPQVQTRLFARRLTQMMQETTSLPVNCISAAPISPYPVHPQRIVAPSKQREIRTKVARASFRSLPQLNYRITKLPSRLITSFLAVILQSFRQRHGYVVVYSVHVPFMISGLALAKLTGGRSVGVWTDPPGMLIHRHSSRILRLIRKFEKKLINILGNRFDLLIVLTPDLAKELADGVPYLVVEAITDELPPAKAVYRESQPTVFTYTGGVSKRYGVDKLVEALQILPSDSNIELKIFGTGDYEDELLAVAANNPTITFAGQVSHKEAVNAQNSSDFLINARPAGEAYTRFSFPSKTLEYLASGVPVLSTRLPGIPEEYWRVLIPIEESTPEEIATAMIRASELDKNQRSYLGQQGRELAMNKTYAAQAQKVRKFLEESGED
ncbi:hypothetical protein CDES_02030 [Corynebacterium deserti GIMN1.010]|uniref:Glycosyltransferase n=1 Tax=Corynebacterium deserti GIMN1.010 TaxID=931089 RepID=A0A0M5ITV5_9CORY|nr:glycosyltransferase [Corynebacterium deserti]ALC04868.1 hypothetical protein CDES_02030 [Corynebacterium deserti GIMN1.010]